MSFFWRIFLSAWAIIFFTIVLTITASLWLPELGESADDIKLDRMVSLVARELRKQLAIDAESVAQVFAEEQVLDLSPILEVFVLTPDGYDVLGRALPNAVVQAYANSSTSETVATDEAAQLRVLKEGLQGFMIVGQAGHMPVRELLIRPEGRGLLGVLLVCVSGIFSLSLTRFIVLPVRRMRMAAQQVASGDLSVRVAHTVGSRSDDIAELAMDFDAMAEKVDTLLQSQKRLMRDVSHELRSPLARLHALLSISQQTADSGAREQINRMEAELERLDDLIGEILSFSQLEAQTGIERHPTDVMDLLENIVDDSSIEAEASGKRINLSGPSRFVMELDSGLIHSAVENVIRNALHHTADGTNVDVGIQTESGLLRVVVDDRGPGVPDDQLKDIFDPFYRVSESRGTQSGSGGIGLAIAQRGVRLHGGTIMAMNRPDGGLRVKIELPCKSPALSSPG
jgi:two-component system sensor histidine kinase CpxA